MASLEPESDGAVVLRRSPVKPGSDRIAVTRKYPLLLSRDLPERHPDMRERNVIASDCREKDMIYTTTP